MFDMGWWELAIVGLMMILVLGPKELPHAMRSIARFMRKARRLASEFQGHMDDLIREADLDDVKQTVNSIKNQNVGALINDAVDPTGELKKEIDGAMDDAKREMGEIKSSAGVSPTASSVSPSAQTNTDTDAEPAKPAVSDTAVPKPATVPADEEPNPAASASSNA